ncbi:MAG: flagellar hook-length control protein FliK [Synergistaceae bacterium]|jgi:hypothetical protein|nr:flagellar hook-length control protein FliK [Synergistaceae bacterium]
MADVGGLSGGAVDPGGRGAGGIRPPQGDGAPVSRPGAQVSGRGIADGSLVEGLVTAKEGEMYRVKIGAQTLSARSTVVLFPGQRFRALWDASTSPPTLRLQHSDTAMLARFSGRDQQVASALFSRGMPVDEENVAELRRQWLARGGDPAKLGAMAELWARGAELTEANIGLLAWYMALSPEEAERIWKKIRSRLRSKKSSSPKELLSALKDGGDAEVARFLASHAIAGRKARDGIDPAALLAPAWWPMSQDGEPKRARVAFSGEHHGERRVWRCAFGFEGSSLGPVSGDVVSDGTSVSINIRLETERRIEKVRAGLDGLRKELAEIPLNIQYLGASVALRDETAADERRGLDMEI